MSVYSEWACYGFFDVRYLCVSRRQCHIHNHVIICEVCVYIIICIHFWVFV